jgi:hypothetical protein
MLLGIRPHFDAFASLFACSRNPNTVYSVLSKHDLFASTPRTNRPPTLLVDLDASLSRQLRQLSLLPLPCFIKVDGVYSRCGRPSRVWAAATHEAVLADLLVASRDYSRAVVQGFVPGRGAAAALVRWNDRILASMQYQRLHEVPHRGGASSLRGVISQPDLERDALERVAAMQWNGPAMFEYRVDDQTGCIYLMELNARFWGSLHLALFAGIDFPAILVRAALGIDGPAVPRPRLVRSRITVPGEIQYVASVWRDKALSVRKRWGAVGEFVALSFSPRAHSDLLFGYDPAPYWRAITNFVTVVCNRARARTPNGPRPPSREHPSPSAEAEGAGSR